MMTIEDEVIEFSFVVCFEIGNCYVKFRFEQDAEKAVADLNNRWFDGRAVYAELSPVTDFHEACCRQYQMGFVD